MYTVPLRWPAVRALPSGLPSLLRTPIAVMPATPSLRPDRSAASPSRAAAVGLAWLGLGLGLGLGLAYPHPHPNPICTSFRCTARTAASRGANPPALVSFLPPWLGLGLGLG